MNKKKIRSSRKTIIILIIAACIFIPVGAYGARLAYILYFSDTPTFVDSVADTSGKDRPSDISETEESGIENVVLFGVDNRTANDHGRTDSIIIATINKGTKVIKLTSLMRDMYVEIPGRGRDRINAAFVYGGPELTLKTINKNFGLDLKFYTIVDFKAFQELVDILGGIDVNVKSYEVNEINYYIREVNGKNSTLLAKPGFQHINGQQALSFARIRKVGNGDFERTERQKIVLKCLADRAKQVSVTKIPKLLTTLASHVQTNIPMKKLMNLGMSAYGFNGSIQSMRIPVDGYFQGQSVNHAAVLVPDIKANAMFLKEFIYDEKLYGNKDNDSHMNNSVAQKPKPNIPNYSTPRITPTPKGQKTTPTGTPPTQGTTPVPTGTPGVTPIPSPTPTGTPGATPAPVPTQTPKPSVPATP